VYNTAWNESNYQGYVAKRTSDGESWILRTNSSSYAVFYIKAGSDWYNAADPDEMSLNTWYHLVGTFDGSNVKLYKNGVLMKTTAYSGAFNDTTVPITIGAVDIGNASNEKIIGDIDEVAVYNRVLSIDEIKCHYERRKYAATEPTIGSVGSEEGKYYPAGNYKANVLDSGVDDTKVHQVDWNPTSQAAGTDIDVYVRASNTSFAAGDGTPSWTSVSNGGNPALVGRYIQWMSTFTTTSSTTTPRIEDITLTYTSPPPAPAVNYNAGDSYTQITWKWADNSSGQYQEDGFKVYSSTGGILKTLSADVTCWTESALKRNTKYGRYVHAYNTAGSSNSVTVIKKTQPCVWQEKTTTRTGPNSFGFEGDGVWKWEVPANGGSEVKVTVYVQYNSNYGGAAKPKLTLYNYGVNDSAQMTGGADTWEKLTVSGTPTGKGVLFLKVEGFSTAVDAKYFVDDIQISQP
ncbi:MAG: LamG domain-containing protein, partial [Elusimicrobia bacterium]|nr:LamG domain-containing protein [Elusimicrobiota bacterium]